jgi:hypothetical protein
VGVGCGLILLGIAYTVIGVLDARALQAAHRLTVFEGVSPSARVTVCTSGPIPVCAAEAARRIGVETVWMTPPPGYRLKWFVAFGPPDRAADDRFAYQTLVSNRFLLELETQPARRTDNHRLAASYRVGESTVQAFVPTDAAFQDLTFTWMHHGRSYAMWVAPYYLLDQPTIDPRDWVGLIAGVHYAPPSHEAASPMDSEIRTRD